MKTTVLAALAAIAALSLSACGGGTKCGTTTCAAGQTCNTATNTCVSGAGGGSGGATGGGSGGGSGGATGGGMTGGGSGGGSAGGGSGGGNVTTAGETCQMATTLTPGTPIDSTTMGLLNDYNFDDTGVCIGSLENTPDAVFKVSVPPGQRATVLVTAAFDAVVNLVVAPASNCGVTSGGTTTGIVCEAAADSALANGTETVSYLNKGASAVDVFVLVDGYEMADVGAFNISASVGVPPAGDDCASAPTLTASLPSETWVNFGNDYPDVPDTCDFQPGPDRVYKLDVPALTKVTIVATPSVGDLALHIIDGPAAACAAPDGCHKRGNVGAEGEAETVVFANGSNAMRTVYLHVSLFDAAAAGETFSLAATFAATPASPAGDLCSTATPLTPGTLTAQTTTGFYSDYNTVCLGTVTTMGPDRVYSINVMPGQTLTATVDPGDAGNWDPALFFIGGPAGSCVSFPPTCLAGDDNGVDNEPETIRYTNDAGTAQSVFIIVDDYFEEEIGSFTLQTTLTP